MIEDTQHAEIMKVLGRLEGLYTGIQNQLTYANGRTGKLEAEFKLIEKLVAKHSNDIDNLNKHDGQEEKSSEKRKDWMWGFAQNILYALIGAVLILVGLVLSKLNILNLH